MKFYTYLALASLLVSDYGVNGIALQRVKSRGVVA